MGQLSFSDVLVEERWGAIVDAGRLLILAFKLNRAIGIPRYIKLDKMGITETYLAQRTVKNDIVTNTMVTLHLRIY